MKENKNEQIITTPHQSIMTPGVVMCPGVMMPMMAVAPQAHAEEKVTVTRTVNKDGSVTVEERREQVVTAAPTMFVTGAPVAPTRVIASAHSSSSSSRN